MKNLLKIHARTWIGISVVTIFVFALGKMLFPMPEVPEAPAPILSISSPSTAEEEKRAEMEKEFVRIYQSTEEPISEREKLVKDIKTAYLQGPSAELNKKLDHIDKAYTYVGSDFRNYVYHDFSTGPSKRGEITYRCTLTGSKIGVDGVYVSQEDYEIISDIDEQNKICVNRIREHNTVINTEIADLISRIRNNEFQQEVSKAIQSTQETKPNNEISAPTAFFNTPTWFQFFARPFLLFGIMSGIAFITSNMLLFAVTGSGMLQAIIRIKRRKKRETRINSKDPSPKSIFDQE